MVRARQFTIAVVGVGLVLALALSLSGLADGFHAEVAESLDAVGATSWVMSTSAHGRVTAFAAFPEEAASAVARETGVRRASALLFAPGQVVQVAGEASSATVNLVGVQSAGWATHRWCPGIACRGPARWWSTPSWRLPWGACSPSTGTAISLSGRWTAGR